jgi:triosephosphate isomerase
MTVSIGVSLKMYFGHTAAVTWFDRVAEVARTHPAVRSGKVELFVIPSFPSIPAALESLEGTGVLVGAQDLFWEDTGAYTGEVSGVELAELGVRVVEVGHAERRHLFFETDDVVAKKATAALRNGLVPVLCLGEAVKTTPALAAREVIDQLDSALAGAPAGRVIVAYEPVWAIGAAEPAGVDHIVAVCVALREHLATTGREGTVIYGGSAGPGLLTRLGDGVDGLFLGRFAHDPAALAAVLDEAAA